MAQKKASIKAKRKKKKWFKVVAPEVFNKKDLGEVMAFEGKELLGRTIELSSRDVGSRESAKKVVLRITKITGETAETEAIKIFIMDNSVQRKSRKIKEKILSVFNTKLSSGQTLKFKILLNTTKHIPKSTQTALINALPHHVENQLGKKTANDVFAPGYTTKLGLDIKKSLKSIYPISHVYVWKVSLLK